MTQSQLIRAIFGAVLALALPAIADDASKHDKIVELMKVYRLDKTMELQRSQCRKQAEQLGPQMMEQLRKDLELEEGSTYFKKMNAAYGRFVKASEPPWSIAEAIDLYAKLYGEYVTEADVDQLLVFFRSPLGQKSIEASSNAVPKWAEALAKKNQDLMLKNLHAFQLELKQIKDECNSERKPTTHRSPGAT